MAATPLSDGVVVLRCFTDDDVDALTAACQDSEIHRFLALPDPYRRADAVAYLARTRRQWATGEKAAFAITDARDPSTLLGAINIAVAGSTGNSGYWVAAEARGRSVALRSLHLLTHWAVSELGLGVVLLEIDRHNLPSQLVATRAGYDEVGTVQPGDGSSDGGHLLFARLASAPR